MLESRCRGGDGLEEEERHGGRQKGVIWGEVVVDVVIGVVLAWTQS